MTGWAELWQARAIPPPGGSTLADLMAADGWTSGFARMTEAAWSAGIRRLAADLGLTSGTSVFEVGCGAGAVLYELERLGCSVGGIDLSPALVAKAREAIPSARVAVCAAAFDVEPAVDASISFGVFLYFDSLDYAEQVLDRMVGKARTAVAVLDVPDLGRRDEDLAYRHEQAGGEAAYAARYAGLEHRYYDREWFAAALGARGLVDVQVADQAIDGYGNAPFRFNARGFRRRRSRAAASRGRR